MCETKTKKRLIGLFLIPLILSIIVSAVTFGGHTAYAVTNPGGGGGPVCTPSDTIYYFGSSSKQTILQEQVGQNPDGSDCSINTTTFQKMAAPPFEYKVGGNNGKCGDTVTLNGGNAADATYQAMAIPAGGFICNKSGNAQSVAVGDTRAAALAAITGQSGTGTQPQTTDCSISDGLGWILCPLMRMGGGIADAALGYISGSFLEVNYQLYSTSSPTYSAWQWVLGFANIFFVIIFLIIIFSQATGLGISNYGIKKMLPKLIVGVVLINLSFFICSIMIDASNLVGYGLNHFFDTLAQGIKLPANTDIGANGSPFTDIVVDIIGGVAALAVIVAAIAFFGPVLLAAIVALLMIFLFLVARQAIIILAIIVAPLAFAAWLLPNTEKLFKQWWKIFVDMLLVFPVIGLVFGASKLVSRILTSVYAGNAVPAGTPTSVAVVASISTNGRGNLIGQIVAAAVLVVPLFAVPFILKGLLDSVPVAGKWAQKAYGTAVGGTHRQSKKHLEPAFSALGAKKRAGVANMFGFDRGAQRDKDGNFIRDAQGRLIGKNGKPLRRNLSQAWDQTKKSFEDNKASYDKIADNSYQERALKDPSTLAGRAVRRSQREDVRAASTSSGFEAALSNEKRDTTTQVGQYERARLENTDVKKDFDTQTQNNYDADILNNPTSRGGRARRSSEAQGVRAARTHAAFESELQDEKENLTSQVGQWEAQRQEFANETSESQKRLANVWDQAGADASSPQARSLQSAGVNTTRLVQRKIESQAYDQSSTLAKGVQRQNYAAALDPNSAQYDPTVLSIAGGTVDAMGEMKAQAYGVQAVRNAQSENVKANMVLVSDQVRRDVANSAGTLRDLDVLQQQFTDAAASGDTDRLRAIGTLMLKQGASGYDGLDYAIRQNMGAIQAHPDMSRDFRGYMVDEHSKDIKVRHRDTMAWLFDGGSDMNRYSNDPRTYTGLTPEEVANQTPESMRRGAASGGIDLTAAQSVLLEDGLVQKMSKDQMEAMVSVLQYADASPATRGAAQRTAQIIQSADTYPRFSEIIKRELERMAGTPPPKPGGGGGSGPTGPSPAPGPGTSGPGPAGPAPSAPSGGPSTPGAPGSSGGGSGPTGPTPGPTASGAGPSAPSGGPSGSSTSGSPSSGPGPAGPAPGPSASGAGPSAPSGGSPSSSAPGSTSSTGGPSTPPPAASPGSGSGTYTPPSSFGLTDNPQPDSDTEEGPFSGDDRGGTGEGDE